MEKNHVGEAPCLPLKTFARSDCQEGSDNGCADCEKPRGPRTIAGVWSILHEKSPQWA